MSTIEAQNLIKGWGKAKGLNDVSVRITGGALVALLGPSGSGKTTLLRILGGLDTMDSGRVLIDGEDVSRRTPAERGVGFVFQNYALFRHLTVFENVAFGLRVKPRRERPSEAELRATVSELLRRIGLPDHGERLPHELSGGQKQRVALARALAVKPRILLLDEPFGALDAKVRTDLRRWLRELHEELGLTTVLVTHDQDEAIELADEVVILNHGRIEHQGSPRSVVDAPASAFAREFIGDSQVFEGIVREGEVRVGKLAVEASSQASGTRTRLVVRPHELRVAAAEGAQANGTITHVAFLPDRTKVTVAVDEGPTVVVALPRGTADSERFAKAQRVVVDVASAYFDAGSGI